MPTKASTVQKTVNALTVESYVSSKDSTSPLDAKVAHSTTAPQNNFTQSKYLVYAEWHPQINRC